MRPHFKNNKGQGGWRSQDWRTGGAEGRNSCKRPRNDEILCISITLCACVWPVCDGEGCVYQRQRTALGNQLSCSTYVGSSSWTQVSRLVQQALLPIQPSCKPFNAFLKGRWIDRDFRCVCIHLCVPTQMYKGRWIDRGFRCVCIPVCSYTNVQVPSEARRACWIPWSYSYRQLWGTWHWFWKLNSRPIK